VVDTRTPMRRSGRGRVVQSRRGGHVVFTAVLTAGCGSLARKGRSASAADGVRPVGAVWGRDALLAGVAVGPCCS
jgi:hypothetical protein